MKPSGLMGRAAFVAAAAAALLAASCVSSEPADTAQSMPAMSATADGDEGSGAPPLTQKELRAKAIAEAELLAARRDQATTGLPPVPGGQPVMSRIAPSESSPTLPSELLVEEHLVSTLEAERAAKFANVRQRIFYPEELFGAPMIRKDSLGPGKVVFYYPLRATGGVKVDTAGMKLTVTGPDEAQVAKLISFFEHYLDDREEEAVLHYPNLNMLEITAREENVPFLLEVLNFLDAPKKQVIIEAAVWEITETNDRQLGARVNIAKRDGGRTFFSMFDTQFDTDAFLNSLTTGQPFQGGTLQFVNTADGHHAKMDAVFQFLQRYGYADLVAQPRMRVNEGEMASILTGELIPFNERIKITTDRREFTIIYRNVGVQLDVIPTLVGQDEIEVALLTSVSEVSGYTDQSITGMANPIIIERKAVTKVRVANRDLITIGGLDQKKTVIQETKVPILGDIPLLKYLFSSSRERVQNIQVWFTLRPTIAGEAERLIVPELTGADFVR